MFCLICWTTCRGRLKRLVLFLGAWFPVPGFLCAVALGSSALSCWPLLRGAGFPDRAASGPGSLESKPMSTRSRDRLALADVDGSVGGGGGGGIVLSGATSGPGTWDTVPGGTWDSIFVNIRIFAELVSMVD